MSAVQKEVGWQRADQAEFRADSRRGARGARQSLTYLSCQRADADALQRGGTIALSGRRFHNYFWPRGWAHIRLQQPHEFRPSTGSGQAQDRPRTGPGQAQDRLRTGSTSTRGASGAGDFDWQHTIAKRLGLEAGVRARGSARIAPRFPFQYQ